MPQWHQFMNIRDCPQGMQHNDDMDGVFLV